MLMEQGCRVGADLKTEALGLAGKGGQKFAKLHSPWCDEIVAEVRGGSVSFVYDVGQEVH